MAGRPKSIDNSKVFDVAKPGKSKPVSTSRPVIVNHSMAVNDASVVNGPGEKSEPMQAPSTARKIIKPISISGPEDEKPIVNKSSITIIPESRDEAEATVSAPATQTAPEAPTEEDISTSPEPTEEPAEEIKQEAPAVEEAEEATTETVTEEAAETAEQEPAKPDEAEEPKAEVTSSSEIETSESASVDALAEASEKPKVDQKVIEEEAKREAALQELIDSKKYVVPLAHDSTKSSSGKGALIALLVILLLAAGAYAAIDAKILKVNIDLPYHFFKQ